MKYRFANCLLDIQRLELRRDGERVPLEPQVFSLLHYFVENSDRVVSKDDLINAVWSGGIVSDSTIGSRISAVRRAIGDSGETQGIIRTIPRRGFIFTAEITQSEREEVNQSGEIAPIHIKSATSIQRAAKPTLMVLPFWSMNHDQIDQSLAIALAGDIVSVMGKFRGLNLLAQITDARLDEFGAVPSDLHVRFGADYVVTGHFRRMGTRLRIVIQLLEARSRTILWTGNYACDLDDDISLPDDVTGTIGVAIDTEITAIGRLGASMQPLDQLDHHGLYNRAMWHLNRPSREDLQIARQVFHQVIDADLTFAPAHSGLAYAHLQEIFCGYVVDKESALETALHAAQFAIEMDRRDAIGHYTLGRILCHLQDYRRAKYSLEEAVDLNPNLAESYYGLGYLALHVGDIENALLLLDEAIAKGNRNPRLHSYLMIKSVALNLAQRYGDALYWARLASSRPNARIWPYVTELSALGRLQRGNESIETVRRLNKAAPTITCAVLKDILTFKHSSLTDHYVEGALLAGLKE